MAMHRLAVEPGRRRLVAALLAAATTSIHNVPAVAVDDEVAAVLDGVVWDEQPPFRKGDFRRMDEGSDADFYETPRLVYHIDDAAVTSTTSYYDTLFREVASRRGVQTLDVLDLCSSWISHYPGQSATRLGRVAGLGMNAVELQNNPVLTEWVTRDLNAEPKLPYESGSFDVVTCTVSIDYLTQPLAVMAEAARVLRPGGTLACVFSNRLFFSKAVALWTGKDDLEHVYTVGAYMHYGATSALAPATARDLTPPRRRGQKGDPLYAVSAVKQ